MPLRLSPPGLESLVAIIVGQQVSRTSADAILGRLTRLVGPMTAQALLEAGEARFVEAGLSRAKQRTMLALGRAVADGSLDLAGLQSCAPDDAMRQLTAVAGIGPWTAECYLMFAAGHRDIFPAGDVALRAAVGEGLGLAARPGLKEVAALAESWSPWRSVAARLFWAYYARRRGRDAVPPSPTA